MAGLSTPSKLFRSSFLASELHDRLLIQDRVSSSDRVRLQPSSALGHGHKIESSPAGSPSLTPSSPRRIDLPKAVVRDTSSAYAGLPGLTALRSMQQRLVVLGKDSASTSERQDIAAMGDTLTALQRSLLETQWALSVCEPRQVDVVPLAKSLRSSGRSEGELVSKVVSSGKPSARQRRMQARQGSTASRRRLDSSRIEAVTAAMVTAPQTSRRRGRPPQVQGSQEFVNTHVFMREKTKRELLTAEQEVALARKMRVGYNLKAVKRKLTEMLGCVPTDDQWAISVNMPVGKLFAKLQEADRARDEMFMANVRLVVSIARRYSHLGLDMPDLIQEGAMGLLRGLEKFNHEKGFKLSTYVHWWIRQGVTRSVAQHSRTVRIPVHLHERLSLIRKAKAILQVEGAPPSVENIAQVLNLSDTKIMNALKVTKRMLSLDRERRPGYFQDNKETMHSYVADANVENNPWAVVDSMHIRMDVDELLAVTLTSREREIVRLHYGLDRTDGLCISLESISRRIGLSRERVRQVEAAALLKLLGASQGMRLDMPSPF